MDYTKYIDIKKNVENFFENNLFPNLNKYEYNILIKYFWILVYKIYESICYIQTDEKFDYYMNDLINENYKKSISIMNLLLPYINDKNNFELYKKIEYINNIRDITYIKYDGQQSIYDLLNDNFNKILKCLKEIQWKLHVNWVDIFPVKVPENIDNNIKILFYNGVLTDYNPFGKIDDYDLDDYHYYLPNDKKYPELYKDMIKKNNYYKDYAFSYLFQINFMVHYKNNDILYVTGDTGQGKSTHIPKLYLYTQYIYNIIYDYDIINKIIISLPRINVTIENSKYISEQLGFPIDNNNDKNNPNNYYVQYKSTENSYVYEGNTNDEPQNKIILVTDGILLNEIISNEFIQTYSTIIIDEAHEHNTNMDMVLTMYKINKKFVDSNPSYFNSYPKLSIISATMDNDEHLFRSFFKNNVSLSNKIHLAPPRGTTRYLIKEYYLDTEPNNYEEAEEYGYKQLFKLINSGIKQNILFFSITKNKINNLIKKINNNLKEDSGYIAIPVYKNLHENIKDKIGTINEWIKTLKIHKNDFIHFVNNPKYKYKISNIKYNNFILVSTNITEASLTIPGLNIIIDTGYYIKVSNNHIKTDNKVEITKITESSRKQRKGRVGRKSIGTVYYMYKKGSRENILPEYEISRSNISKLLQLLVDNNFDLYTLMDFNGEFYFIHPDEYKFKRDLFNRSILNIIDNDYNEYYNKSNKLFYSKKIENFIYYNIDNNQCKFDLTKKIFINNFNTINMNRLKYIYNINKLSSLNNKIEFPYNNNININKDINSEYNIKYKNTFLYCLKNHNNLRFICYIMLILLDISNFKINILFNHEFNYNKYFEIFEYYNLAILIYKKIKNNYFFTKYNSFFNKQNALNIYNKLENLTSSNYSNNLTSSNYSNNNNEHNEEINNKLDIDDETIYNNLKKNRKLIYNNQLKYEQSINIFIKNEKQTLNYKVDKYKIYRDYITNVLQNLKISNKYCFLFTETFMNNYDILYRSYDFSNIPNKNIIKISENVESYSDKMYSYFTNDLDKKHYEDYINIKHCLYYGFVNNLILNKKTIFNKNTNFNISDFYFYLDENKEYNNIIYKCVEPIYNYSILFKMKSGIFNELNMSLSNEIQNLIKKYNNKN